MFDIGKFQMASTITHIFKNWEFIAQKWARGSFSECSAPVQSVTYLADEVLAVCISWPDSSVPELRDQELQWIRERLAAVGIEELAVATYPKLNQPAAGYSAALILAAGDQYLVWIHAVLESAAQRFEEFLGRESHSLTVSRPDSDPL